LAYEQYQAIANNTDFESSQSYKRFSSFKRIFEAFLKKKLTWDANNSQAKLDRKGSQVTFFGTWKVDSREFNYKELSEGERLLFAYALVIFLTDQNPDLDICDSILIIDEPELHLHPDSELDLIQGLRNIVGERGQIIFATHSINILSHLNYEEIYVVKNGKIYHPSQSTIKESLIELLSLEERVNKLSDFLSSISTWTFVNFMAECFSSPDVIESSDDNDPQIIAFKNAVISNGSRLNMMLDFGAGKGRLYEHLRNDYDFFQTIEYSALEPEEKLHPYLKNLGANNVYKSHSNLPKNSFDFILLCNVLHEIPILEWQTTLNSIINSLKEDGFLIIIEAKILTKGEKIGKEGFLLLDREEIQTLFNLETLPSEIKIQDKSHLITCSIISKKQLNPITKKDIKNALAELEKNSMKKLIELREISTKEDNNPIGLGRKNAFLSQLHINSKIAQLSLK
jgi:energy-coupling factor transporter ATP-binding protein EcfA2